MLKWMNGLAILCALACAGCGAKGAEPQPLAAPSSIAVALPKVRSPESGTAVVAAPAAGERRVSRTVEDDRDADGISDYRIIITDTFDANGNLVSTLREEDFEADGIIDARSTTWFEN